MCSPPPRGQLIAIDYDGVVADTNRVKSQWIGTHLDIEIPPSLCNRSDCVPLIGESSYERMAAEVYERDATLAAPAVKGAKRALEMLADRWRLLLVTARTQERLSYAAQWLAKHQLHHLFADLRSSEGTRKTDIALGVGAAVLVDDDIRHLKSTPSGSPRLILFSPGVVREIDATDGILVADSWDEVVELVSHPDR